MLFAEAYGVRHLGYFHLVVATMYVCDVPLHCRLVVSHLRWRTIRFDPDGSSFELTFEKRKNAQFRQVRNKVVDAAAKPDASVCPLLF